MGDDSLLRSSPVQAVAHPLAGLAEASEIPVSLLFDCLKALAPMIHAARVYDDDPCDEHALDVGVPRGVTQHELFEFGRAHGQEPVAEACAVLREAMARRAKSPTRTSNKSRRPPSYGGYKRHASEASADLSRLASS